MPKASNIARTTVPPSATIAVLIVAFAGGLAGAVLSGPVAAFITFGALIIAGLLAWALVLGPR